MDKRPVLTVSQLNFYIKNIFDNEEILHNICLAGEIFDYKEVRGTAYFVLKDQTAQIDCVCFSAETVFQNQPVSGSRVVLVGSPTYYSKGGKISFSVRSLVEEKKDEGDLYKSFLALKEKLLKEGLFDPANKVRIPMHCKKIAVITSPTGAVIQDIISVARRRNTAVSIALYPAQVQGIGAVREIERAICYADSGDCDAIILARGGGSAEDLSVFNDERVVRAVYNAKKPLITAIGHETDTTLADFASDLRAATPSAAAELCVFDQNSEIEEIKGLRARLLRQAQFIAEKNKNEVERLMLEMQSIFREKYSGKVLKDGLAISSVRGICAGDKIEIYFQDGVIAAEVKEVKK